MQKRRIVGDVTYEEARFMFELNELSTLADRQEEQNWCDVS